jgi:hypothetical protein
LNFRDDFFEGIDPLHSCQRVIWRVRFGLVQQSMALSSLLFAARFDRVGGPRRELMAAFYCRATQLRGN